MYKVLFMLPQVVSGIFSAVLWYFTPQCSSKKIRFLNQVLAVKINLVETGFLFCQTISTFLQYFTTHSKTNSIVNERTIIGVTAGHTAVIRIIAP